LIRLPTERAGPRLADWIELELLFGGHDGLAQAEIESILGDDLGLEEAWTLHDQDDPSAPPAEPDDSRELIQGRVEQALMALEGRRRRTGDQYPIGPHGPRVVVDRDWRDRPEFAFLALLSARVTFQLGAVIDAHEPALLFERLVKTALRNYLNGEAARFGWPLDGEFDGDIYERIATLASLMREHPQREFRSVSTDGKDHGLDVAAWAPFDDRGSQVIVLCQCGIGSDFREKVLPERRWPDLIRFLAPTTTALAVPFEDFGGRNSDTAWNSLAIDAGILLDRSRLTRFADASAEPNLIQALVGWVDQSLPHFLED